VAYEGQKNWKLNVQAQPRHSERGAPITGTNGSQDGGGVSQPREISAGLVERYGLIGLKSSTCHWLRSFFQPGSQANFTSFGET